MLFNSASILAFLACASFTSALQIIPPKQTVIANAYSLINVTAESAINHQIIVENLLDQNDANVTDEVDEQLIDMYDEITVLYKGLRGGPTSNLTPHDSSTFTVTDCSVRFGDLLNSLKVTGFRLLKTKFVAEKFHHDFQNITQETLAVLRYATDTLHVINRLWLRDHVNTTELESLPDGFAEIAIFLEIYI